MEKAYKIPLNWERVLRLSLCRWFKAIEETRNTPREYISLNPLPMMGIMMGPRVSVKMFQEYLEKPDLFMLVLGELVQVILFHLYNTCVPTTSTTAERCFTKSLF